MSREKASHFVLLPAWAAYGLALAGGKAGAWLDRDALILGMQVEWMAVLTFPMLAGLAGIRGKVPAAVRAMAFVSGAALISGALHQTLGLQATVLYWLGGGLTYFGWLFDPAGPDKATLLLVRWAITVAALIPVFFLVVAAARLTGAEPMLLLGACYFLLLEVLEATGAYRKALRWSRRAKT